MKLPWKTFAVGLVAAYVGENVARPMLVSVVRAGIGLQNVAAEAIQEARTAPSSTGNGAAFAQTEGQRLTSDVLAELRALRAEVATMLQEGPARKA